MNNLVIEIDSETARKALGLLQDGSVQKTLLEAAGQEVRVAAIQHFKDREAEPEKTEGFPKFGRSFGKRGFWHGGRGGSVAEQVGAPVYDPSGPAVTVPIDSPALAHKADPNPPPITPKGGRTYLAIPANARAAMWAGMPRDFDVPGGMKFGYAPTPAGRWVPALVARENFLRTVRRGAKAGQRVAAAAGKATSGALQPQYWLVRRVQTAHDPRAMPDPETLTRRANARAASVLALISKAP